MGLCGIAHLQPVLLEHRRFLCSVARSRNAARVSRPFAGVLPHLAHDRRLMLIESPAILFGRLDSRDAAQAVTNRSQDNDQYVSRQVLRQPKPPPDPNSA
jgi:hypothetical protein